MNLTLNSSCSHLLTILQIKFKKYWLHALLKSSDVTPVNRDTTFHYMPWNTHRKHYLQYVLSTVPGEEAWYSMEFGSPFLFSGTTVWHTAIRVRNSRITGAVTCGEHQKVTKFTGTVLRRGTLQVLASTIYSVKCKKVWTYMVSF